MSFSLIPTSYDRPKSGVDVLKLTLEKMQKLRDAIRDGVLRGYGRKAFVLSDKALPERICYAQSVTRPLTTRVESFIKSIKQKRG